MALTSARRTVSSAKAPFKVPVSAQVLVVQRAGETLSLLLAPLPFEGAAGGGRSQLGGGLCTFGWMLRTWHHSAFGRSWAPGEEPFLPCTRWFTACVCTFARFPGLGGCWAWKNAALHSPARSECWKLRAWDGKQRRRTRKSNNRNEVRFCGSLLLR